MTQRIIRDALTCISFGLCIGFVVNPAHGFQAATNTTFIQEQNDDHLEHLGKVVAGRRLVIKNQTRMDLRLIFVAKEGTVVKKGDLIAKLDTAKLEEQISEHNADVNSRKAELIQAEQALAVTKISAKLAQKEAALKMGSLDSDFQLLNSKTGVIAIEQDTLGAKILLENKRSELLNKKLDEFKKTKRDGIELEELKYQLLESQTLRKIAENKLAVMKLTNDHQKKKIVMEVETAKIALEQLRLQSEAELESILAEFDAKKNQLKEAIAKLKQAEAALSQCNLQAPSTGVVYYSHQQKATNEVIIEEGAVIRPNQSIAYLPDLSTLEVEIDVPESQVKSIKYGQPAAIEVEGKDGEKLQLAGKVKSVAQLPNSGSWVKSGKKTYTVRIEPRDPKSLKLGQSAKAIVVVN